MTEPRIGTINAQGGNVVVADRIDAVYQSSVPPPRDYILDFAPFIASATTGFVGRDAVFEALATFVQQHVNGYFEIVADAGLGKTAIAAEVTRRRDAIAFFASASRGRKRPEQFLTHVCAELIVRCGLDYDHLPARAGEDNSFLDRLLREVVASRQGKPLFIVVDALDEADEPSAESNPLLLPTELPESVFVVVTRRSGRDLITLPSTPTERYRIRRNDPEQHADIKAFLKSEVTDNQRVARALANADPPVLAEVFAARLRAACDGNFMYVSYVLADTAALSPGLGPLYLLPKGLPGYYEQFWTRIRAFQEEDWDDWDGLYRPTIERLGVAAEAVTADWLAAQVGRRPTEIRERALQRWERLLSREEGDGQETWQIVHRSFSDFLSKKVDLRAAHIAVAYKYAVEQRGIWHVWDDYGLRHTVMHLIEGARRSSQPDRHALVERLVELVTDPGYQGTHLDRLLDPILLESDLVLAVRAVAEDDDVRASLLADDVALTLLSFRREHRKSEPIFELARRGEVEAAARRLDLFSLEVDRDWYHALLLTIAWLAAPRDPKGARELRDRVCQEHFASSTLELLLERFDASLSGAPMPDVQLPPAPSRDVSVALVERLGGAQGDSFLQSELGVELRDRTAEMLGTSNYLAEHDGPLLVAAAVEDPGFGEPLLRQYLAVHSAYGYRQYRQGSLWALLKATLQHPSQEWVRMWAAELGEAALAPNLGEFAESLGLAALLVRALAGDAAALAELEQRRDRSLQDVQTLPNTQTRRGAGDTWGLHKRRLAALAEVFSQLPDGSVHTTPLLSAALQLRYGFAGFHAPACLALAEAIEVAEADPAWADEALTAGLYSAHNIQDETFCARTTARVNAMRERWWVTSTSGALDVVTVARRLLHDPSASEFTALHLVGDDYDGRDPTSTMPLSPEVGEARTLEELAAAYERPLVDFLRVNTASGWAPQHPLDDGVHVNVPDPGLPPLIAARLSARALADHQLSDAERIAAVRALVPVAASEPTALHTVLARQLLAWRPADPGTLARLTDLATKYAEQEAPDAKLAGRISTSRP